MANALACQLGSSGALVGKPAGVFFSTGTQGGGQETTALTWVTQLVHHGMLFVPIGETQTMEASWPLALWQAAQTYRHWFPVCPADDF